MKKNKQDLPLLSLQSIFDSDECDDYCTNLSTVNSECNGATTNSEEECSYSSELDDITSNYDDKFEYTHEVPSCIYSSDKGKLFS